MSSGEQASRETATLRRGARIGLLFPGQGATHVHEAFCSMVKEGRGLSLLELACRETGIDKGLLQKRPSLLERTEVLQPVLVAMALSAWLDLEAQGLSADIAAGHSLGELAAWAAAGGIEPAAAVMLAAIRGRLMAREAAIHPGGMVALATSDKAAVDAALQAGRRAGKLVVAAHNAPNETVLSGDEAAVRAVLAFAPEMATRIPTAGAWHSPAMAGALEEWRTALREAPRKTLTRALVLNRTGETANLEHDLPDLLAEQLVRPVEWCRSIAAVRARAEAVITLGPGAVLRSLWHRNERLDSERTPAVSLFATDNARARLQTGKALSPHK